MWFSSSQYSKYWKTQWQAACYIPKAVHMPRKILPDQPRLACGSGVYKKKHAFVAPKIGCMPDQHRSKAVMSRRIDVLYL